MHTGLHDTIKLYRVCALLGPFRGLGKIVAVQEGWGPPGLQRTLKRSGGKASGSMHSQDPSVLPRVANPFPADSFYIFDGQDTEFRICYRIRCSILSQQGAKTKSCRGPWNNSCKWHFRMLIWTPKTSSTQLWSQWRLRKWHFPIHCVLIFPRRNLCLQHEIKKLQFPLFLDCVSFISASLLLSHHKLFLG
jgi:hypothetical protein